ncbi:hypothetical protein BCR37DRAFT_390336 [Protomyces lactucae-debilis]|uniref:Uncharacterized protein n=1 Tax=Protomyces lactucae-debilis TaxID=2754530 RepID=A0A1Y2FV27_PROLT|nr:uncharacterized protein BCR37DRAFT_390336 [Protomyces lactucae-debilis]ORY87819.1 hypothetical protein BCR37DRAFT_390336 [Protomyces lactucae-debilis]
MAPPTKVFPETVKPYYSDPQHQVSDASPITQMTQYDCDLSNRKVVTCIPIDRFFRVARGGGIVEIGASEAAGLRAQGLLPLS